jgi:hypothetical protein
MTQAKSSRLFPQLAMKALAWFIIYAIKVLPLSMCIFQTLVSCVVILEFDNDIWLISLLFILCLFVDLGRNCFGKLFFA